MAASKLHGRRKSIAVMEHRHLMSSVQCRSQDSEMAQSERNMRLSWSVVVGEADCRSVDTGLNELDRVIGKLCIPHFSMIYYNFIRTLYMLQI